MPKAAERPVSLTTVAQSRLRQQKRIRADLLQSRDPPLAAGFKRRRNCPFVRHDPQSVTPFITPSPQTSASDISSVDSLSVDAQLTQHRYSRTTDNRRRSVTSHQSRLVINLDKEDPFTTEAEPRQLNVPSRAFGPRIEPPTSVEDLCIHPAKIKELKNCLEHVSAVNDFDLTPMLVITGPPGSGKRTCFRLLCSAIGIPFRFVDIEGIAQQLRETMDFGRAVGLKGILENLLTGGILYGAKFRSCNKETTPVPIPPNKLDRKCAVVLENIGIRCTSKEQGSTASEFSRNAREILAFWRGLAARDLFLVLILTDDMAGQSAFIHQLDLMSHTLTHAPMRIKFNDVAASIMKKRLKIAMGLNSKNWRLTPENESLINAIVQQSKGDMSQALLRLDLDCQQTAARSGFAGYPSNGGKNETASLFELLGKCMYSKRIKWIDLESKGLIPKNRADMIRQRRDRLTMILNSALIPPPIHLEDQLLRGNVEWLLPQRLIYRSEAIYDQQQLVDARNSWAIGLESTSTGIGLDQPVIVQGENDLLSAILRQGQSLTDKAVAMDKKQLFPSILRPPSYFSPKPILQALMFSDYCLIPGMFFKSLPLILMHDLIAVQRILNELAALDALQARMYGCGIECDKGVLNFEVANIACELVRDISYSPKANHANPRSLIKMSKSGDKEIVEARKARRLAVSDSTYHLYSSIPSRTDGKRITIRPLSITKFEQDILSVLLPYREEGTTTHNTMQNSFEEIRSLLRTSRSCSETDSEELDDIRD